MELRHPPSPRLFRLISAAIVASLVGAGCGAGSGTGLPTTTAPTTSTTSQSTTSTTSATPTSSLPSGASQNREDAIRDGVVPEFAELPFAVRVGPVTAVDTAEGRWTASRPTPAADSVADGCRIGPESGRYPTDFICTIEYGELLLLDSTASAILQAYPLPGVPAEGLLVTDEAVYCWRTGDPMLPDAMVCRVDRVTRRATVVVYPAEDSIVVQPCFYPPAGWVAAGDFVDVDHLTFEDERLWVIGIAGERVELDPTTLETVTAGS